MNPSKHPIPTVIALALAAAMPALAQQAPDAGQTLRQLQPAPSAPAPAAAGVLVELPRLQVPVVLPGGPRFEVKGFVFEGNTQLSAALLAHQLHSMQTATLPEGENWLPIEMDLAELTSIAQRVSQIYWEAGYPFAQAHVPAQRLENGQVRIVVVEGRYDKVKARSSDPRWEAEGQQWLASLVTGQVIRQADLERVALLLQDLPGVAVAVSAESGASSGAAAVDAEIKRKNQHDGEAALTNHGSRFSGEWQGRVSANLNSPFMLGDQIAFTALHTDYKMWQGAVNYSAPLGYDGWRATVGYSDTRYELTKGFEGTRGNAKVSSVGVSYPLLRAQRSNLRLLATLQDKRLFNSISNGASIESYSATSLPLVLNFDHRDQLGEGGITYGLLSWTNGDLKREDTIRQGSYQKWNLDVSRVQTLAPQLSLFGRVSAQRANKNLDSTEGFGLGGPAGVRAYPTGEAFGDEGWMAQIELRYAMGTYAPYAFYDHGRVKVNAKPEQITSPSPDQERAGAGLGVRYAHQAWRLDAALAWRTKGGAPAATQGSDPKPRAWVALSYKF